MADHDEESGSDFADTPYVPTGPRRSTFTPPVNQPAPAEPASTNGLHGDDELANALADEVSRYTGTIPVQDAAPAAGSDPESAISAEQPPVPVSVAPPVLPARPHRTSLPDEDLVRVVDDETSKPGGTLNAIEQLESQLRLREEEAREFGAWESAALAVGTPEVLETVEQARIEFTGVIPIQAPVATPSSTVSPGLSSEPSPAREPEQEPGQGAAQPAAAAPEPTGSLDAAPEPESAPEQDFTSRLRPPWLPVPEAVVAEPAATPEQLEVPEEEPGLPEELEGQPGQPEESEDQPSQREDTEEKPGQSEQSGSAEHGIADEPNPAAVTPAAVSPVGTRFAPPPAAVPVSADESVAPQAEPTADAEPAPEAEAEPSVDPDPAPSPDSELIEPVPHPVVYDLVDPFAPPTPAPRTEPALTNFDALLAGGPSETPAPEAVPFALLDVEPGAMPAPTGSHPVIAPTAEPEPSDDVDDTDRAFVEPVPTGEELAILPPPTGSAPIEPLASPRIQTGEQVIPDTELHRQPVFTLEASGIEPTPLDHRVGRAARMFWLWFSANSSVVSVAFGAALFSLGMSLRQAILAVFIGVAISFLPLGLGTLAGKWSGQPTMVVSRATFGLVGNIVPAVLALIVRLFWGAVLLWIAAASAARILIGASAGGPFTELQLTAIAAAVGFVIALVVAFFGYPLFARIQLILSVVSALLIIGLIAVTWHAVNISTALTTGDGPWILVVTGVVLVFSFVGLIWASSSGDLARYQRPGSSGASASLWAPFGATLPAFLLIAYGALVAASDPTIAKGLIHDPMDAIAQLVPGWYPVPLLVATALSLLSGITLSIYSGAFALQAIGLRVQRQWAIVIVGALLFVVALVLTFTVSDFVTVFRDVATSLAVPVAAWAGIFAAEIMIRRRRFDGDSLLRRGGVYPTVNWVNLAMLVIASVIGYGFTSATVDWLGWQGYGFTIFNVPLTGGLGATDLGVLFALVLGLLTPLAAGVSTVRRQERIEI